jgi:TatD DNase family protein
MAIFDSHCHLYWEGKNIESIDNQLNNAEKNGINRFMCVGTNIQTSLKCLKIAATYPQVIASAGIHPNDVEEDWQSQFSELKEIASREAFCAIGETGLDYFHKSVERDLQKKSFSAHLDLAEQLGVPVIIHCRDAIDDLVTLLEIGLHFSFSGNISYPKSDHIRESCALIPIERLLIETDAPFLAPQPERGKRNQPAYIVHTLDAVAQCRGTLGKSIESQIYQNTLNIFNVN